MKHHLSSLVRNRTKHTACRTRSSPASSSVVMITPSGILVTATTTWTVSLPWACSTRPAGRPPTRRAMPPAPRTASCMEARATTTALSLFPRTSVRPRTRQPRPLCQTCQGHQAHAPRARPSPLRRLLRPQPKPSPARQVAPSPLLSRR